MVDISGTIGGIFSGLGTGIGGSVALLIKIFPYIIVGGIVGWLLWMVFEDLFIFKHKVKLKRVVGNGLQWYEDKAMEKRLKNGAKIWQLKKLKIKTSIPPNKVLMNDKRGKIVAEGYLLNDNQIIWGHDKFSMEQIKEQIKLLKKKVEAKDDLTKDEEELLTFDMNFQPVTTNDRIVLADAMADSEFGKLDVSKLLEKALPWIVVIMMLILFLFGFKYYVGPLNEMGQQSMAAVAPVAELNKQTAELLYAIENNFQLMQEDLEFLRNKEENEAKQGE